MEQKCHGLFIVQRLNKSSEIIQIAYKSIPNDIKIKYFMYINHQLNIKAQKLTIWDIDHISIMENSEITYCFLRSYYMMSKYGNYIPAVKNLFFFQI